MIKSASTAFVIAILFLFFSCKKNQSDTIPYVKVDVYIYPSQPLYNNLNIIGGWVYVSGGVRGIIVYRHSQDLFYAYERNCPYDAYADCATVKVLSDNITVADTCCGSKFIITDGTVINGPATQSLLQYQASYDGNMLHIYN